MQTGFCRPAAAVSAFVTFNGGNRDMPIEFAQISVLTR